MDDARLAKFNAWQKNAYQLVLERLKAESPDEYRQAMAMWEAVWLGGDELIPSTKRATCRWAEGNYHHPMRPNDCRANTSDCRWPVPPWLWRALNMPVARVDDDDCDRCPCWAEKEKDNVAQQ